MFDNYLVRKQVMLDYKILKKMKSLYLYVFGQMGLEILFDDHRGRKQALLDYKKLDITKLPY